MIELKLKWKCYAPDGICPYTPNASCIEPDFDDGIPRTCPYLEAKKESSQEEPKQKWHFRREIQEQLNKLPNIEPEPKPKKEQFTIVEKQ